MDVTNASQVEAAKKIAEDVVGEKGITLLINNAGFAEVSRFPQLTEQSLKFHFDVNTVAPILLLQSLYPLLQKAACAGDNKDKGLSASRAAVLNITSMVGSISNTGVHFTQDLAVIAYKTSKAALNMAMRTIAALVKEDGILVVNMCPGWVKTDMGTENGEIEPVESIKAMLNTLITANEEQHGTFMDRFGNPYPF